MSSTCCQSCERSKAHKCRLSRAGLRPIDRRRNLADMLLPLIAVIAGFDPMKLPPAKPTSTIPVVELAPVFYEPFVCGEHPYGSLHYVGDALGRDCVIVGGIDPATDSGFPRPFRTSGAANADWYGWHAAVHAPFTGRVVGIHQNSNENTPGVSGKDLAGYVAFRRRDGLMVTYAHVTNVSVRVGQEVTAGQVVGLVGNNGHARMPHIHIGAWRGTTAYQVRWDLHAEGRVPALRHQ